MKIALMPNLTRKEALSVTLEICKTLDSLNAEYCFLPEYEQEFGSAKASFLPEEEALSGCDAVIAIGGDGSIIHAAKSAVKYRKPVLGVNAGRLAFMGCSRWYPALTAQQKKKKDQEEMH